VVLEFARWYGGVVLRTEEDIEVRKINNTLPKGLRLESHHIPQYDSMRCVDIGKG
jgi:hypothetical protein